MAKFTYSISVTSPFQSIRSDSILCVRSDNYSIWLILFAYPIRFMRLFDSILLYLFPSTLIIYFLRMALRSTKWLFQIETIRHRIRIRIQTIRIRIFRSIYFFPENILIFGQKKHWRSKFDRIFLWYGIYFSHIAFL